MQLGGRTMKTRDKSFAMIFYWRNGTFPVMHVIWIFRSMQIWRYIFHWLHERTKIPHADLPQLTPISFSLHRHTARERGIMGSEEEAEQGQGTSLAAARNLQERGMLKTIGVSWVSLIPAFGLINWAGHQDKESSPNGIRLDEIPVCVLLLMVWSFPLSFFFLFSFLG